MMAPVAATAESPLTTARGLEVEQLSAGYSGVAVVRDATLHVAPGEVVALLGPNGAGKTTMLGTIGGLLTPIGGRVVMRDVDVTGRSATTLARSGLALVPEGRALFPSLTVAEHLRLLPRHRPGAQERLLELLPELRPCLHRKVGLLSGGEQQMLAVGRTLVTAPDILLVDEMSMGLAPQLVQRLFRIVRHAADELRTAVLVVEQHVSLALEAADRAYVLNHGRIVLEGAAEELLEDRQLMTASYLGETGDER